MAFSQHKPTKKNKMAAADFEKMVELIEDIKENMPDAHYMAMMNFMKKIFEAMPQDQVVNLEDEVEELEYEEAYLLEDEVEDLRAEVEDLRAEVKHLKILKWEGEQTQDILDITNCAYMEEFTKIMKLVPIEKKEMVAKIDCHGFGLVKLMEAEKL